MTLPCFAEQAVSTLLAYLGQIVISGDQLLVNALIQAGTFTNLIVLFSNILGVGSLILVSRLRGAGDERNKRLYAMSLYGNIVLGIIASLILVFCADSFFALMKVDSSVIGEADDYMLIVGSTALIQFVMQSFAYFLRTEELNKELTIGTTIMLVANILLESLFLFVFRWGIKGVAWALTIARLLGLLVYAFFYFRKVGLSLSLKLLFPWDWDLWVKITKVGFLSVIENISYNVAYLIMIIIINGYGVREGNITSFVTTLSAADYLFGNSLVQVTQVEEGKALGERDFEKADQIVKDSARMSMLINLVVSSLLIAVAYPLFLFLMRDDPAPTAAAKLALEVTALDFLFEFGRILTVAYIRSLQVAGDVTFVTVMGFIFTWLCLVGGSYLFGNVLGLGLLGCWLGMSLDAVIRGVIFVFRWRSGKWKKYRFAQDKDAASAR
jgi:putative MATE family efflux protein